MPLSTRNQLSQMVVANFGPERIRHKVVRKGAKRYADGLIEAIQPFKTCIYCMQNRWNPWAFREFAKVAGLVNESPQVAVMVVQQLGMRVEEARRHIEIAQSVEGISEHDAAEKAAEFLRAQGWTVLAPSAEVNGNGVVPKA